MEIAQRTLDDLAYAEILRALSNRCRSEPGRQRALARPFLETRVEVEDALTRVDEARKLAQEQFALPFGAFSTDLRPDLRNAAKGGLIEPRQLVAIAQALFSFVRVREALEEREEAVPALAAIGRRLPELEDLARRVDRCFEADGEISDRASPALKEARDRVRGLHRNIKARLDELLHDERFLPNLRESYYTLRNGRYVLPILAQHRAEVPGIVHNASQTGQTLFVEPQAMVGLGNDLAIAQSLVTEEERRLLQELSDQIGRHADRIAEGVEACAELDEAEAAARLSVELDAARPGIGADGLELLQLRHPLLVLRGQQVVANDVRLSGDVRSLVVSGPNAGGKTVTLTAVGLCSLMLRAGLPIPAAAGSTLPLYRSVHTTLGDAQDINQGLSTFSAHLTQLREIGRSAGRGSLVLIDEIAADTDPREGAAIAIAVLEELLDHGAVVLVTTHLEELKALAHMDPRFVNARVGFDPKRMAPTYRLQLGAAGSSSAIAIAERVGLSERICQRARELALGAGGPLAKALAAAEEERRKLAEELERARQAAESAEAARAALEKEKAAFEQRRKEEELEHHQTLKTELDRAMVEVKEMLARMRAQASMREAMQVQQELAERLAVEQRAVTEARAEAMRVEQPSGPPELKVGGWVHHVGLGRDVEVLEVAGDEVLVAAGPLKMRVPVAELAGSQKGRPQARFPASPAEKQQVSLKKAQSAAAAEVTAANFRCDVRGMRADEALREVEQFLDRIFRSGEESATIIHGHGTGALRQAVREYLGNSPYVRMFRPGEGHEGGDGVTVVAFRT